MPTCTVVTAKFANYVAQDSASHGMPLRYAYPPYPVGWVSQEVLHAYVEGNDPITTVGTVARRGFKTKAELRQWLLSRIRIPEASFVGRRPVAVNLVVVGGEWNPMFTTTDFQYTQTVSIDEWIPKKGIRFDKDPIRMPSPASCKDGACGIH